ncbi:MAG: TrkH family potassium uptake protein [Rhodobacterales bacterium]|nr:TrkH family potassium uptake protein [Rhodobacterales bacterium]
MIGFLICALSATLLVPAAADWAYGNPDWHVFVYSAIAAGIFGGFMVFATGGRAGLSLNLRGAFLLTGLSWILLPAVAALPFTGLGISYTNAFFETASAVTTTGSTIFTGLDDLPPGILLWRAILQWIGGVGIIVLAIILLPFLRVAGSQLFRTESSDTSDKVEARSFDLVGRIMLIYTGLTLACAGSYFVLGMTLFDAFCHAMATISTGGFSTHDASFGYYGSTALHWSGTLFMLTGAMPFYVYIKAMHGDFRSLFTDSQVRLLVAFLTIVSIAMAFWLSDRTHIDLWQALTLTAFNITSVVTTTGFATADYTLWGPGAVGLFLVLMFVGGCSGSTSGAVKIYRFQILYQIVRTHLRRLASPNRVLTMTFNGRPLSDDVPFSILAFLAVFVATVAIFTLILTFMDLDLVTAYSATVTAITNVGPGLGPIVGPAGNFTSLPDAAKWLLSAAMILGRLELFTLLVMFDRDFWGF